MQPWGWDGEHDGHECVSGPWSPAEGLQRGLGGTSGDTAAMGTKYRKMSSKYDFVKVRVLLCGKDHYYVLSRYLISRTLTVTKIPYVKAVKIALELKKHLVDMNMLAVTQVQMEQTLFRIMEGKGFGAPYIERYQMVNQFFQERCPLLILICGAPCTGKSTLAQQLAARLNLPNVVQTDLVYQLLRSNGDSPVHSLPVWKRSDLTQAEVITEFRRECWVVRKGVDGEVKKALKEGKSIILEGVHLQPDLYIQEFTKHTCHSTKCPSACETKDECHEHPGTKEPFDFQTAEQCRSKCPCCAQGADNSCAGVRNCSGSPASSAKGHRGLCHECCDGDLPCCAARIELENGWEEQRSYAEEEVPEPMVTCAEEELECSRASGAQEWGRGICGHATPLGSSPWSLPAAGGNPTSLRFCQHNASPARPVFMPIIIQMDEDDHELLATQWATRSGSGDPLQGGADFRQTFSRLRLLQKHLCEWHPSGVAVVRVGVARMAEALDKLHDHFLDCIQKSMD
eukprot:evm.model.scf_186.13 EVM.evm.TU.scf_186.13   scf_186:101302-105734(-)